MQLILILKDLSVFENGMQRVGSSFAMLIKAALAQSKKRNQQKNEVNTRELKGQEKVEQQSKAEDSLVLGRKIVQYAHETNYNKVHLVCIRIIYIFISFSESVKNIVNPFLY